ncbi:anaerobic sulfatase maturase [Marinomonas sp. CT5]|uniref:anaerobic sulfatase maturase n=1 Tax=Marinomonas sp. CT5 TaxID=2066133 RepID=UPI001BAF21A6|nr:anaerobic sulfatase maturase [Marinomonas sp. CT5]QUX96488.1 anaerobic sulfatase maturase [Marinomonas sp. CT5]
MDRINAFSVMAKPSSSVCNIDCTYCFYLEKEHLYPNRKKQWRMNGSTLEHYIRDHIQSQQSDTIDFIWQGGEPTLLGIDFFRQVVEFQKQYQGYKTISNSLQTNGTLLDDEWAVFLKENQFLVGVSIDGDRISNDTYRLSRKGKSTFDDTLRGIELLKKHRVDFNTLTVINAENVKRPLNVYAFLKRIGSQYMQFIPLVEREAIVPDKDGLMLIQPTFEGEANLAKWSVPAKAYGKFLNTIFDYWVHSDLGKVFVMNFEQTMSQLTGRSGSCVFSETCGNSLAMESNGDVYSCDHYVYSDHKLGNISEKSLIDLVNLPQNLQFGQDKLLNISRDCYQCEVRSVCHGGCPKHRFEESSDGVLNRNYLCDGFKSHFTHVVPKMSRIIDLLGKQVPIKKIRYEIKKTFYR